MRRISPPMSVLGSVTSTPSTKSAMITFVGSQPSISFPPLALTLAPLPDCDLKPWRHGGGPILLDALPIRRTKIAVLIAAKNGPSCPDGGVAVRIDAGPVVPLVGELKPGCCTLGIPERAPGSTSHMARGQALSSPASGCESSRSSPPDSIGVPRRASRPRRRPATAQAVPAKISTLLDRAESG